MAGVSYCGPTNSTFFTNCCNVAICDHEQKCPFCRKDVYPFYEGMSEKDRDYYRGGYYNHNTRMSRSDYAHRNRWWK